jgi:hypothetical protein
MQQQLQPILFPTETPLNADNSQPKGDMGGKKDISDHQAADAPDPQLTAAKPTSPFDDHSSSHTATAKIPQPLPDSEFCRSPRGPAPDALQMPSTMDEFFIPIDPELIQHFKTVGTRYFKTGDYANAKRYLEESLKHSETKYGKRFEGRESIMKQLRASYWVLCDWDSLRRTLTSMVNENCTNEEEMLQVLYDLSELYFVAAPVDLISAERVCRKAIQKKINYLKTREHGSVYESLDLLVRILHAKGEYLEAEAYRKLFPSEELGIINSFSIADEASYQLETWCRMSRGFAAAQFVSRFSLRLILFGESPTLHPNWCNSIRQNILKVGVLSSTGKGNTIGHNLIEHGRVEALEFLLKRGLSVEAMDDKRNTLLGTAVCLGRPTFVKLLLKYGADINAQCSWSIRSGAVYTDSILNQAILQGAPNEIKLMLVRSRERDSNQRR